ncbi:MAG: hypothetical protein ACXWZT_06130 [Gaiellaceae bacterium]
MHDPNKLADFYKELFDWQINKVSGIDYFQIPTAPREAGAFEAGCCAARYRGRAAGSTSLGRVAIWQAAATAFPPPGARGLMRQTRDLSYSRSS